MNIIILGAAGFIGTNLTLELLKNSKNKLTLVDRNKESLNRLKALCNERASICSCDLFAVRNLDRLLEGQDIVYQFICTTVPTSSNQQISNEIKENVIWMSELLESCVKNKVKKVVFLSSGGTVYGDKNMCPLKEEMETYPINSYGVQKVMNEKLLYLYHYKDGLDYRIVRLANPFGPFQDPNGIQGVVAACIYKALKKEDIFVYGDGSIIRDYIYIEDAVKAVINIAVSEREEKLFNIGSGKGTSIHQLLDIIEDTLKVELKIKYLPGRTVDVPVNFLDVSKYEKIFGKLDLISLEEGIKKTADFMRKRYF